MGRHESFTPPRPPERIQGAVASVDHGVRRIFEAVYAHREAPNAALQMAEALADLMKPWIAPLPNVTSTNLIGTSLAQAIMNAMIDDPRRCAQCYNDATLQVPEAGIKPLLIRDDYVELPLWRIRDDGRRMHAYDSDLEAAFGSRNPEFESQNSLLPRALFMTALVRLVMCDLFIHGTGGAVYDRTMEIWMKSWLGVEVGAIAIATANLRLPLMDVASLEDSGAAIQKARQLWHDPEPDHRAHPGPEKSASLAAIESAPRNSPERKARYLKMHEQLAGWRARNPEVEQARHRAALALRRRDDAQIACRRDWAFPLYPTAMIDELAERTSLCARQ